MHTMFLPLAMGTSLGLASRALLFSFSFANHFLVSGTGPWSRDCQEAFKGQPGFAAVLQEQGEAINTVQGGKLPS